MPVINPVEKQAFIDIVKAAPFPGGPQEALRLEDILVNYTDIVTAVNRQQQLFASNNSYLTQAMSVFSGPSLLQADIWFNTTQTSPPAQNPVMIINCTLTNVSITASSPIIQQYLTILGPTVIDYITIDAAATLQEIFIGPGARVKTLDASDYVGSPPSYARVNLITLAFDKSTPSYLDMVTYGSSIGSVLVQEGSYYGGVLGADPQSACASAVTGLAVTDITFNSVLLEWTPPAGAYLFINVFYRETNSSVWVPVTVQDGEYVQESGFVFRSLDKDTLYDFMVRVICLNGGYNDSEISGQTVCCGYSSPP